MTITSTLSAASIPGASSQASTDQLRETFQKSVAGLFFGQLVKSLRSTAGEAAYIHGGQAEKMFQSQLDQVLVEDLAATSGGSVVDDLYAQFRRQLELPPESAGTADGPAMESSARDRWRAARVSEPGAEKLTELPRDAQSAIPDRSLQARELIREARSVSEGVPATTATAALTGLFRK